MKKIAKYRSTSINSNDSMEGSTIEQKIERLINNKEPIGQEAPLIFTEKKEGVKAGYNIRTDRFEVALDAITNMQKAKQAQRAEMQVIKNDDDGKTESTQTNQQQNE